MGAAVRAYREGAAARAQPRGRSREGAGAWVQPRWRIHEGAAVRAQPQKRRREGAEEGGARKFVQGRLQNLDARKVDRLPEKAVPQAKSP